MPIYRPSSFNEAYRLRAAHCESHAMTGRERRAVTHFVNENIIRRLEPNADDVVVDVGCGDAFLLRKIASKIRRGIGITATSEEADKVRSETVPGETLEFIAAGSAELPIPDGTATKVICNSVLFLLPSDEYLRKTVRELFRISAPGALVWIGEIPRERETQAIPPSSSGIARIFGELRYFFLAKDASLLKLAGRVARALRAAVSKKSVYIVHPKDTLFIESDELIALAKECGAEPVWTGRHQTLDGDGQAIDSTYRWDYLFRAVKK